MKPVLVVNPNSGGGKLRSAWRELESVVIRTLGACDVQMTGRPGHGSELAHEAAKQGAPLVVAVGGDGTLSEVVDGVMRAGANTEVGFIGQGTGGDFRRSLGFEHRLSAYLERLQRPARPIDVGEVTYTAADGSEKKRYFINVLSCGMGGLVDEYMQTASRALGGTAAYFGATLRALMNLERARLRCTYSLQGESQTEEVDTLVLAICNGQYFGSGMQIAPMAKLDDGVMEVLALQSNSRLDFFMRSSRVYFGKHLDSSIHFRADEILVETVNSVTFPIDLDGEAVGKLPMRVRLHRGGLRMRSS